MPAFFPIASQWFEDLPDDVKEAATALGFTKEMWDDDEWPKTGWWEDMSPEQKSYAMVLGYAYEWQWD